MIKILMFDLPIKQPPREENRNVIFGTKRRKKNPELLIKKYWRYWGEGGRSDSVTEISGEGMKRYSLDDYEEMEAQLNAKPSKNWKRPKKKITIWNLKPVQSRNRNRIDEPPIPQLAYFKAVERPLYWERKRKMKEFNYKFRNSNSKIDEIEKQPAYKRMGIRLDDTDSSDSQLSRTTVNTDDDELDLRSIIPFLW